MNDRLRRRLKLAPGITLNRTGIIYSRIDFNDGLKLLRMEPPSLQEVGKWVQVRRGTYKGDVGYVTSTNTSGVQLALIPRLSPPYRSKGAPSCPAPALFDNQTIKRIYDIEPVRIQENIYSFRGDRFEHGLLIKSYPFALISTTVSCMPLQLICLFMESYHPKLMESKYTFLKPLEWHFAEGDEVNIVDDSELPAYKSSVISTLRTDSLELSTEEGIVCVPWLKVRKVVRQGSFVAVTGGMYQGRTGWVADLEEQVGYMDDHDIRIKLMGQMANIVEIGDEETPLPGRIQVFPIPNALLLCSYPLRCFLCLSIY
jgi:hypothetical protein